MKPDSRTAMHALIAQVRTAMPFDAPRARICSGDCQGCSRKLLDHLDAELGSWEARLAAGETPNFGDLSGLAKTSRKIHGILARNGLVDQPPTPH